MTPTSFGKGDPTLKMALEKAVGEVVYSPVERPLTSVELLPLVRDVDGYIAGLDYIDQAVIQSARRLRVIARYGVGFDRVDVPAATARGIVVTNTPGANSTAVAELSIGLMLALGRSICLADRATRRGEWPRYPGIGLRGKIVGLVGFGAVGREVASRLMAFGCRILVSDPQISYEVAKAAGVELVRLEELLALSDFVSLHASLNPESERMVDRAFLAAMKRGAFLVNTARGELIMESALKDAIEKGHLRGAALDCFTQEPPRTDHPFFGMDQVLVTPHMASHTDEAVDAMGRMSLQACLAALRGERYPHTVNPEVYNR